MFSSMIAKISLSISLITFAILVIVISIIMVDHTDSYEAFIQAQIISHENMPYVIGIAGLLLVFLASLISWFVSLYGSFKIAGPLYRFSHNLRENSDQMLALRSEDCLQDLSNKIINAAKRIESHKQELRIQIEKCQELLAVKNKHESADSQEPTIRHALQELRDIENKVKIGGLN